MTAPIKIEDLGDSRYRAHFVGGESTEVSQARDRAYSGVEAEHNLELYERGIAHVEASLHGPYRALDIACGSGYGSDLMSERGWDVTAVEAHPEAVRFARLRAPGVEVIQARAPDLGFLPDTAFNAVFSIDSIEHIEDDVATMAHLHRVLRPVGRLVLSTPQAGPTRPIPPSHFREYSQAQIVDLIESAGFDIDSWWRSNGRPYGLWISAHRKSADS